MPIRLLPRALLVVQLASTALVVAAVTLTPPVEGTMLILSLRGERQGGIAAWAVEGPVRLAGAGPLATSLVVRGPGAGLSRRARAHGALLLAAPSPLCGDWPA